MHRLFSFLVLSLFFLHFPRDAQSDDSMCRIADQAIEHAVRIRGLKQRKKVPCKVENRDEIRAYLIDIIENKIPEGRIDAEGHAYKAIGLIAEDYDYKQGLVDLYVSQIGGYYDPEKDFFVMAGWMPALMQAPIAVHELTHALQDQHFRLDNFIDIDAVNGDQQMARSALVEGDASAVMLDYSRALIGQPSIAQEGDVNDIILQNALGAGMIAASSGAPQSLIKLLIFPYTSGLRFAHVALQRGGYKELDRIFRRPPNSSEEILHPEIYFKRKTSFREVRLDEFAELNGAELIFENVMGEIGLSVLLNELRPTATDSPKAAEGWGGDKIVIFEKEGKKRLQWKILWDSPSDADEFFEAFSAGLESRFGKGRKSGSSFEISNKSFERKLTRGGSEVLFEAVAAAQM